MSEPEEWKDVSGYEGAYQVSNFGRLRSLDRKTRGPSNQIRNRKGRMISGGLHDAGYPQAVLWENRLPKKVFIHRLVAMAFIPNPLGLKEVNHKNFDKADNSMGNLEWVTPSQNVRHAAEGGRLERWAAQRRKPVFCITNKTQYRSANEAGRALGINPGNISLAVNGKRKSVSGMLFERKRSG